MTRRPGILILFAGSILAQPAFAEDFAKQSSLKAIEAYAFVLPAIDCYRDTTQKTTTSQKALQRLLRDASAKLGDDDADEMATAAIRGAKAYERAIADRGRETYCKTIFQRYGPAGSVYRGLVIAKKN